MKGINWLRVLTGGIAAGIVANVLEMLFGFLMQKQWESVFSPEQAASMQKPTAMAAHLLWAFVLGIALVWLYAAIRPRFGPGAKTAVIAGVFFWLTVHVTVSLALSTLGFVPTKFMAIGALWTLPESVLAALAGGWIYREA